MTSSLSLNQGSAFIKGQTKLASKKNSIKKSKSSNMYNTGLLPHYFEEGLTTMGAVSLEGSAEAQQSQATLTETEVTDNMVSKLDILNAQYRTALQATRDAQNKYNNGVVDYISRTNPTINTYSNKNIKLSDGTIGYMTNRGVFEQYDDIDQTAGINGCPSKSSITDVNFGLFDIDKNPSIIALGPNKPAGSACGFEGTNIFVNSVIADADVKYLGCYQNAYYGAMTTIGLMKNYEDCKLYAMNNGYKYFAMANLNVPTQQVTLLVGNDKAKITSRELGYIYNNKPLYYIGGNVNSKSASLTNEGSIIVFSEPNATGSVYTRVNNGPSNCARGGTIQLNSATYGSNCNSYQNKTTRQECSSWGGYYVGRWWWRSWRSYCRAWRNIDSYSPRYKYVSGNNVLPGIQKTMRNSTSNQQYSPVTTIIDNSLGKGLSKFTTSISNSIFGDPAPGCYKSFSGSYTCGSSSRGFSAMENGSVTMNCSDVVASCKFYLILQDDGNMCIYRGTGPNDNKGLIWSTNTTRQQFKRGNPATAAAKGKYKRNYMLMGEYLNRGEWIGSTNGSLQLMMTNDKLVLYTIETYDSWVKMKSGKIASVNNDFYAVYELSRVGVPSDLGKMGYINDNGVVSEYPNNMVGAGKGYMAYRNIDVRSNDLGPRGNQTDESCAKICDSNDQCFGYVYNKSNRNCFPKNKNILRQTTGKFNDTNADFYMRNPIVSGANPSCNMPVTNVESTNWGKYQKSGKTMNTNTLCSKVGNMAEIPILGYKQDFDAKKKISDDLAARINEMNKLLQSNTRTQNTQTAQNTTNDIKNNAIYNTTMDAKIPVAVQDTIDVQIKEALENMDELNFDEMNGPSQRAKSVQFKNIDAIVEDSTLVAVQENYNYILWSILALMTTIICVKALRKQQ